MSSVRKNYFLDRLTGSELTNVILGLFFLSIALLSIGLYNMNEVHALSPLISFREYRDEPLDWLDGYNNFTRVLSGLPSTDLFAVNYFSDGQTLNATLWLTNPFKFNTTGDKGQINYGMLIDADSNPSTGLNGIDYNVEISGENGTWTESMRQYWSLEGYNRTLYEHVRDRGFYGQGNENKYTLLSADLKSMGFPSKYKVLFYAEQFKEGSIWKSDYSNWILIPPPDFEIAIKPDTLDVKQGDQKNIEMQIRSAQDSESIVRPFTQDSDNSAQIEFGQNSTDVKVPPNGMKTLPLKVLVPGNASIGQHTTQILVNGTFSPAQIIEPSSSSNGSQYPTFVRTENITKGFPLSLTVEARDPINEALEQLNKWQFPITFISGIVIGQLGPWIFRRIRKKS